MKSQRMLWILCEELFEGWGGQRRNMDPVPVQKRLQETKEEVMLVGLS